MIQKVLEPLYEGTKAEEASIHLYEESEDCLLTFGRVSKTEKNQ
ncbi:MULTISPECIES: hypothetical protein [Peribacillus]|nr:MULTISPECIES: hypothetical protein [unclassified Peribacillus]